MRNGDNNTSGRTVKPGGLPNGQGERRTRRSDDEEDQRETDKLAVGE
jgi:hypothetical protein